MFIAKNPPYGAIVNYYLKEALPAEAAKKDNDDKDKKDAAAEKSKDESKAVPPEKKEGKVKITVVDKDGKPVREFDGPGAAGGNRTKCDRRGNPPAEPTPEQQEAIAAGHSVGPRRTIAEPGDNYRKTTARE